MRSLVVRLRSTLQGRALPLAAPWLALTLVGWLMYVIARALWSTICLGAPLFDWQWYLAALISLVASAVYIVWRQPRSRLGTAVLIGMLVWLFLGYSGFWKDIQLYPGDSPPVSISFWSRTEAFQAPQSSLRDLRAAGGKLYLSLSKQGITSGNAQDLVDGLRYLDEHEIDVILAVRASDYLSVPVHDEWIANVKDTVSLVRREEISNVRGVIGDAEHPNHYGLDVWGTDRDAFSSAVQDLEGLRLWMRDEAPDLNFGVTAEWPLYLDTVDGDPDLSVTWRSPVDPPGGWDLINMMTYSSFVPPSWRAYYVYLLEGAMARLYPDLEPTHLIGLAAGAEWEPVLDFDELVRDTLVTRATGAQEIVVYRLDGAEENYGTGFVRRLTSAVNDTPSDAVISVPFSRPASILVFGTLALDAVLDARGWRGWFFAAWAVVSALMVYHRALSGQNLR